MKGARSIPESRDRIQTSLLKFSDVLQRGSHCQLIAPFILGMPRMSLHHGEPDLMLLQKPVEFLPGLLILEGFQLFPSRRRHPFFFQFGSHSWQPLAT